VDGVTGLLVKDPTVGAFAAALRDVASRDFDGAAIRAHAETFSRDRFKQQFQALVAAETFCS
jgi:glycosyltransferase involved in cell wall biosynthesis